MDGAGKRALIVAGDTAASGELRRLLEHYGVEVTEAGTVKGGIEGLKGTPDFVFLGLTFADGDGVRVLEQVRARGMKTRVVVLTAVKDRGMLGRVAALRPEAILTKPLDFMRVLELMRPAA